MNYKNLAMWAIIVFLTIGLYNMFKNPQSNLSKNNQINFSEFLTELDNGRVIQVEIKGNNINGVLSDGNNFSTYAPNDPNLIEKLSSKNVTGYEISRHFVKIREKKSVCWDCSQLHRKIVEDVSRDLHKNAEPPTFLSPKPTEINSSSILEYSNQINGTTCASFAEVRQPLYNCKFRLRSRVVMASSTYQTDNIQGRKRKK